MPEVERQKRPEPERTGPIRSFSDYARQGIQNTGGTGADGADGVTREAPNESNAPSEATSETTSETTSQAKTGSGESAADGATGAVNLGYRVIDEYIRQGQRAAQQLGLGIGLGTGPGAASFQTLSERILRDGLLWLEHVAKVWSTLDPPSALGQLSGRQASAPGTATGARDSAPEATLATAPTATAGIIVEVSSRAPAEVELELRASATGRTLGVQDLRTPQGDDLRGCRLSGGSGGYPWRVAVRVPDRQMPGLYTGVVFDRADESVQGTLSVRISPEDDT